jgi:hypothetical protein
MTMVDRAENSNDRQHQTYGVLQKPGQLIEVRRRKCEVAEVASSKLESASVSQN